MPDHFLLLFQQQCAVKYCCVFTLKPLNPALPKRHGQIEWDIMFMITHHPQKLKLKLIQRLQDRETQLYYIILYYSESIRLF